MLMLIALIVVGVAVIAVAAAILLRSPRETGAGEVRSVDAEGAEGQVYEKLYGTRSGTVSAPVPLERPAEADVDTPRAHAPDTRPRTHRQPRSRDSHQS